MKQELIIMYVWTSQHKGFKIFRSNQSKSFPLVLKYTLEIPKGANHQRSQFYQHIAISDDRHEIIKARMIIIWSLPLRIESNKKVSPSKISHVADDNFSMPYLLIGDKQASFLIQGTCSIYSLSIPSIFQTIIQGANIIWHLVSYAK